ncbi:hypothetical protein SFK272_1670 [Shigella flexneri K-272]|nr:hypothetical protein SFK272_1670 [Shigella flexneri K-272]
MTLKIFLLPIVKMGGVMRDDRFNSLKQEFSGVPDDAADALSSMPELIRAAFFLLSTREYKSTGINMRDIYHETIDRAFLALSHSENMLEILRIWLETLGDNERDKQKSRIATALITLLEPVIMELQEIDLLHDRYKEQHTGE